MRLPSPVLAALLLCVLGPMETAADEPSPAQKADAYRRHDFDPATPLESRVKATPGAILKMFQDDGAAAPTPHEPTEAERAKLSAAFKALPPLHRKVLAERLRGVSFLDGMPNTALTSVVNPGEPYRLCDLTIRAGILKEDVSEWFTAKERTCFDAAGSPLSVDVEAGSLDAILYVLLHESTHVVDAALRITPAARPGERIVPTPFIEGVWIDRTTPAPRYRDPLLGHIRFRADGAAIPIDRAESLYRALMRTPFASLYGSSNFADDLAELAALHHLTDVLKQPYRIVIRKEGREVFACEPMKSDLVRTRIGLLKPFYEEN